MRPTPPDPFIATSTSRSGASSARTASTSIRPLMNWIEDESMPRRALAACAVPAAATADSSEAASTFCARPGISLAGMASGPPRSRSA